MTLLLIDEKTKKCLVRDTTKEAHQEGNAYRVFSSYEEILAQRVAPEADEFLFSTSDLLEIYNANAEEKGAKQVKKFENKETAARRLWELFIGKPKKKAETAQVESAPIESAAPESTSVEIEATNESETEGENEMATKNRHAARLSRAPEKRTRKASTKGKAKAGRRASNTAGGGRGRTSEFEAKRLYPTADAKKENPRRKGSHGFKSLQIIIDNPGISGSAFTEKGGRFGDLRYDIEHGNAEARDR